MASRVLLVVVVLWASLAMIGGAVHLAKEADAAAQDTAVKAGLGLCAVSFAFIVRKARSRVLPPVLVGTPGPTAAPLVRAFVPRELRVPPLAGPSLPILLQVSRT